MKAFKFGRKDKKDKKEKSDDKVPTARDRTATTYTPTLPVVEDKIKKRHSHDQFDTIGAKEVSLQAPLVLETPPKQEKHVAIASTQVESKTVVKIHSKDVTTSRNRKRTQSFFNVNELKELQRDARKELHRHQTPVLNLDHDLFDAKDGVSLNIEDLFSQSVYKSFSEIRSLARELNIRVLTPEFVFIGRRGHGKSSLLEAILGYTINVVDNNAQEQRLTTLRPLYFNLVNNPEVIDVPKCTVYYNEDQPKSILSDKHEDFSDDMSTNRLSQISFKKGRRVNKVVPILELNEYLDELMTKLSDGEGSTVSANPIFIDLEFHSFLNITFIDAPGFLNLPDDAEEESIGQYNADKNVAHDIVRIIHDLVEPAHRHIIAVDEASNSWADMSMFNYVKKKFDPTLTRTTLVVTKFHSSLKHMDSDELHRFMANAPSRSKTLFVSLFSSKVRVLYLQNRNEFNQVVLQAYRRDKALLSALSLENDSILNATTRSATGIYALRNYVLRCAWESYQHNLIPELLNNIRTSIRRDQNLMSELANMPVYVSVLKSSGALDRPNSSRNRASKPDNKLSPIMNTNKSLRLIATHYMTSFLTILNRLVSGSCEGLPSELGETITEENESGVGPWLDEQYRPHVVNQEKVQFANCKLYGGQQLRRLLLEFKSITDSLDGMKGLHHDDINAGSSLSNDKNSIFWVASELVTSRTMSLLHPLVQTLIHKLVHIAKRLPNIVQRIIVKRFSSRDQILNKAIHGANHQKEYYEHFPFFTSYVNELFDNYVDGLANRVEKKCSDEFLHARTIYYHALLDFRDEVIDANKNLPENVKLFAEKLFRNVCDRISHNVSLKCFEFFIIPLQNEISSAINSKLSSLTDETFEQLFQMSAARERLQRERAEVKSRLQENLAMEKKLLVNSTLFSQGVDTSDNKQEDQTIGRYHSIVKLGSLKEKVFKYKLYGLESEQWKDQKVHIQEQSKTLEREMVANLSRVEQRKEHRRSLIVTDDMKRNLKLQSFNTLSTQNLEAPKTSARRSRTPRSLKEGGEEDYDQEFDAIINALEENEKSLVYLNLDTVKQKIREIDDIQLQDFAAAFGSNTTVRKASISGKGLSTNQVIILTNYLKENKTLEELDLSNNEIDDGCAQALSAMLKANNTLKKLNLDKTFIQNTGWEMILEGLEANSSLTSLVLNKFANSFITGKINVMLKRNGA